MTANTEFIDQLLACYNKPEHLIGLLDVNYPDRLFVQPQTYRVEIHFSIVNESD